MGQEIVIPMVSSQNILDTFGDLISGTIPVVGWSGDWGYRSEANTGGLQKVGVRWYDPQVDRFLQKDPAYSTPFYSFCKNDPVDLNDAFTTADEAGIAAIAEVWWKSKSQGVEFGGWIYENPDGTFSYTKPVKGTENEVSPPKSSLPKNAIIVGGYHNHLAGSMESEYFSERDRIFAREHGSVYMLTPTGYMKRYIPGKGDSTFGILN